jgi:hypothetical protein
MINVAADVGDAAYEADGFFPGTIWSVQPAHSTYGFSGVPTNGMTVANAAWRNFNRLTGRTSSQQTDSYGTFVINGSGASALSIARSNKGGVEILPSQVSAAINTGGFFYAPDPVKQYVLDNSSNGSNTADHEFCMLMWFVGVRANTAIARADEIQIGGVLNNSGNSMTVISANGNAVQQGIYSNLPDKGLYRYPSAFPIGSYAMAMASGRSWITKPTIGNFTICAGFGNPPSRANAVWQNASPGGVFYRADLIDLTVSGLDLNDTGLLQVLSTANIDYEQVRIAQRRALDFAFGSRGKFTGDNIPVAAASFP